MGPVNQVQSLLVSWSCKQFVQSLRISTPNRHIDLIGILRRRAFPDFTLAGKTRLRSLSIEIS